MVRFIIRQKELTEVENTAIYIPIWLDLLYGSRAKISKIKKYLHSNMVRFIIFKNKKA